MNCNGRGMATLLQQKNYMKSLSNGGVGGGGNNNPNNGTTSAVTTTTLQQTRMLLPHEIASAPSIQHSHTIIPASGVVTQTGTGFIMTGVSAGQTIRLNQQSQLPQYAIQTTSNHNQFQTPISLQQYTTHNNTFFPQLSHNGPNTIFLPVSIASNNNVKFSNVHTPINTVVPSSFRGILNTATQNHVYQQSYPAMTSVITNRLPTIINSIPGPSTQYPKIIRQEKTIEKPIAPKKVIEWVIQKPAVQKPVIIQKPIVEKSVEPPNKPEQHQIDNTKQIKQQPINNPVEDKKCDINKTDSSTAQKIDAKKDENAIIEDLEEAEAEPEVDIVINNVVCSFSVRCHLNLRDIALNGFNVEFRRQNAMVTMKLRRPYTTASIWSSGRITCTGATSEDQAKIAARRYARCLQKLGFRVRFQNFRIVNVLGTCSMPWAIKIVNFSEKYKKDASYEPELHPGVTYKIKNPRATMKIFSTGSITVTANSVANVQAAIEHIYPLVYEFRKKRTNYELELLRSKPSNEVDLGLKMDEDDDDFFEQDFPHPNAIKKKRPLGRAENDPTEDIMNVSGNDEFDDGDDIDDINI